MSLTVQQEDERRDADREKDLAKHKLTLTECIAALLLAIACVSLHAIFLGKSENDSLVNDLSDATSSPAD